MKPTKSSRALIVDDQTDVQNVLVEIISMLGYKPTVAGDGLQAWARLRQDEFDLVVTDLVMPGMNGDELVAKMRKHSINTPVIIIAGINMKQDNIAMEQFPNCGFVKKPFKIEEIRNTISELVGKAPDREKTTSQIDKDLLGRRK